MIENLTQLVIQRMKPFKQIGIVLLLLFCTEGLIAQEENLPNEKKLQRLAEDYYLNGYYGTALTYYERLEKITPGTLRYKYLRSICYIKLNQHVEDAVKILEDIKTNNILKEDKFKIQEGELLYYLAKAHHILNDFDEAETYYQQCLDAKKLEYYLYDEAKLGIKWCENAREIIASPIDVTIENVGKPVNSPFDEHSAIVSADQEELVFTSKRPGNVGGKMDVFGYEDPEGMYFEDIFIAKKTNDIWRKPYNIVDTINSYAQEASTGLSADGQTMFLYISSAGHYGDVYFSEKVGDKWTAPSKLPEPINSPQYLEDHVCISGTEQEVYFTSDRPGGFGGSDIYVSRRGKDGEWGSVENLGPRVNTEYDEVGPYIHVDSKTLFFSSKGHNSMGGFDIFKSVLLVDGKWSPAENIGYPLNTAGDDVFFVLSADGTKGFYTSRKSGGLGGSDIYSVEVNYEFGNDPVVIVLKGIVNDLGQAVDAIIVVTDIDRNVVVGEYQANSASGDYLLALPPDKNYDVHFKSKDGKLDKHVSVLLNDVDTFMQIEHNVELEEMKGKRSAVMDKISYNSETGNIDIEKSSDALKQIEELMKNNPGLNLEVVVLTDTTNKDKLNLATALGKSIAVSLDDIGDDGEVTSRAEYNPNPLVENKVELEVIQGNLKDQIIIQNDKLFVKKENNLDVALKESAALAKEVEKKTTVAKNKIRNKELKQLEEEMSDYATKTNDALVYKIQIAAFNKKISPSHAFFKGTKDIKLNIKFNDGITRYTVGTYETFAEAMEKLKELRTNFYDAYVSPYKNGQRIPIEELMQMFDEEELDQ